MKIIKTDKDQYSIAFKQGAKFVTVKDLSSLSETDLSVLTTLMPTKKKSKAKIIFTFEQYCNKFNEKVSDQAVLIDNYINENIIVEAPEEYVEPVNAEETHIVETLDTISLSDIDYSFADLTIACTVLAAKHRELECPPLLLVVGPSGVNKTGVMRKFRDDRFVKWTGRATAKAWLPGRPNGEADRSEGIFERSNNRCIIQNEIASMRGEDNMDFILGIITDSYGPEGIVLDDGAGEVTIPTFFTTIFGMTDSMYYEWIKKSLGFGQRFLALTMENDYDTYHSSFSRPVKMEDMRKQWISLIDKIQLTPLANPSDDMLEAAYSWAKKIMVLTSLWDASCYEKTNGGHRLADQLITMALLKAALEEKTPTINDVEYFFELTVKMIPKQNEWKKILNHARDSGNIFYNEKYFQKMKGSKLIDTPIFDNLFKLGIFKDNSPNDWSITDEWLVFLNEVKGMW